MKLSPHEQDRLLLYVAAMVAHDRRQRGVKLNHPEVVALIACYVMEGARDGKTVAQLASAGRGVVRRDEVIAGVPRRCSSRSRWKRTFPTGPSSSPCTNPYRDSWRDPPGTGDLEVAPPAVAVVEVTNVGDRPIQVGSHSSLRRGEPKLALRPGCGLGDQAGDRSRYVRQI